MTAVAPAPVSGGAAGANWVAMNAAAGCIAKMVSFSDEHRDLAFGPGDGSWQLAQFGGLNQYGEPFAAMYLDSLLWGGPAFIVRDGVDSGGAMVILGGGTEDVEQQEVGQPLLYLWRREVPDSGGAGRHRGGVRDRVRHDADRHRQRVRRDRHARRGAAEPHGDLRRLPGLVRAVRAGARRRLRSPRWAAARRSSASRTPTASTRCCRASPRAR